jgi:exodeoxyribonuclease VII large subunit
MNKSLNLPLAPLRIAAISSPTAAGYEDFMNQLENNIYGYRFSTRLFKAVMQGESGPSSIIDALNRIFNSSQQFDVVTIIRGGGAQVDLDCFDHYELANHVAQFPIPVLTGVGHERDETIIDLVAHTRLKTPTAVAEFLIGGVRSYEEQMLLLFEKIASRAKDKIREESRHIQQLEFRLKTSVKQMTSKKELILERRKARLSAAARQLINRYNERLNIAQKSIEMVHPDNILKRGYTLSSVNGKPVDKQKIKPGDQLITRSLNQTIKSEIKTVNSNQNE